MASEENDKSEVPDSQHIEPNDKKPETRAVETQGRSREEWGRILLITIGTMFAVIIVAIF